MASRLSQRFSLNAAIAASSKKPGAPAEKRALLIQVTDAVAHSLDDFDPQAPPTSALIGGPIDEPQYEPGSTAGGEIETIRSLWSDAQAGRVRLKAPSRQLLPPRHHRPNHRRVLRLRLERDRHNRSDSGGPVRCAFTKSSSASSAQAAYRSGDCANVVSISIIRSANEEALDN